MKNEFALNKAFCCFGFQNSVSEAGRRGISLLVIKTSKGIGFRLQSRGIAFEDQDKLKAVPNSPDIKINISSVVGLKFCPWCGRKLEELVKASPVTFEELADIHMKMLP